MPECTQLPGVGVVGGAARAVERWRRLRALAEAAGRNRRVVDSVLISPAISIVP